MAQLFSLGGFTFMSIKRRKLGLVMFSVAALSFLVARMSDSRPVASQFWWEGNVGGFALDVGGGISWLLLIPIILVGVIGLFCLAWPSRKPPKLTK